MIIDDPVNSILWLSDIHFVKQEYYDSVGFFKRFISGFLHRVNVINSRYGIDYIVFSGDIACRGTEEEYICFENYILKPLVELENARFKFIFLPGNHDVNRNNNKITEQFVKLLAKREIGFNDFFKNRNNKEDLIKVFSGYESFIHRCNSDPVYKKFMIGIEPEGYVNVFYGLNNSKLHFHVVDRRNNIVIHSLNSAWFSLGGGFVADYLKILKEDFVKNKEDFGIIEQRVKDYFNLNEFGTQIMGLSEIDWDVVGKIHKDYPDSLVLTFFHHPLRWLHSDEYEKGISNDPTLNREAFIDLLKSSDIVGTGHEHPIHEIGQNQIEGTWHIPNGSFMPQMTFLDSEAVMPNLDRFQQEIHGSWFTLLRFNRNRNSLQKQKFVFDHKDDNTWKETPSQSYYLRNRDWNGAMSANHRDLIIQEFIAPRFKNSFINRRRGTSASTEFKESCFDLVVTKTGGESVWTLFLKDFNLVNYKNKRLLIDLLIALNNNRHRLPTEIEIVMVDVLISKSTYKKYKSSAVDEKANLSAPKIPRSEVYQNLVLEADKDFNQWRNKIYCDFESKREEGTFYMLKNIAFTITIVPYWQLSYLGASQFSK